MFPRVPELNSSNNDHTGRRFSPSFIHEDLKPSISAERVRTEFSVLCLLLRSVAASC